MLVGTTTRLVLRKPCTEGDGLLVGVFPLGNVEVDALIASVASASRTKRQMSVATRAIAGFFAPLRWPIRPDWRCFQDAFSEQSQLIRNRQQLVSQIFSTHSSIRIRQQKHWQYRNIVSITKQQIKNNFRNVLEMVLAMLLVVRYSSPVLAHCQATTQQARPRQATQGDDSKTNATDCGASTRGGTAAGRIAADV